MHKTRIVVILLIAMLLVLGACESTPTPASETIVTTTPALESAKTTYEKFLTYEKFRQFDKMWPLLHPDVQDIYDNMDDFINEMDNPYSLKEWTIGSPQLISQWTGKSTERYIGTDVTYSNVAEIPVTWVYSTVLGEIERSQMVHAVAVNDEWKFFTGKTKPAPVPPSLEPPSPIPTPPLPPSATATVVTLATAEIGESITQHGLTITLDKVEINDTDTRVFISVNNESTKRAHLYSGFGAVLVQDQNQINQKIIWDDTIKQLESTLESGTRTSGVIVFEPLNPDGSSAKLIWPAPETEEYVEFQDWIWEFNW